MQKFEPPPLPVLLEFFVLCCCDATNRFPCKLYIGRDGFLRTGSKNILLRSKLNSSSGFDQTGMFCFQFLCLLCLGVTYRCHVIFHRCGSSVLPDSTALTFIYKDNNKFLI